MEVTDGVLEAEDPQLHALCYLRSLDGLDETRLGDTNGLRHIDGLKVDGKVSWCPLMNWISIVLLYLIYSDKMLTFIYFYVVIVYVIDW